MTECNLGCGDDCGMSTFPKAVLPYWCHRLTDEDRRIIDGVLPPTESDDE